MEVSHRTTVRRGEMREGAVGILEKLLEKGFAVDDFPDIALGARRIVIEQATLGTDLDPVAPGKDLKRKFVVPDMHVAGVVNGHLG